MINKTIKIILIFLASYAFADEAVRLEQSVDRNTITIGDRINYDIKLVMPESFAIPEPEKIEEIGEFFVKGIQTYKDPKDLSKHIRYTLTAYTTGQLAIPEISVKYVNDQQKEEEIKTQPVTITVQSVLSMVKGKPALRDIAPVMNLKVPLSVYLIWLLIIVAVLTGAGISYYLYKKKMAKIKPENLPPPIPPDQLALEALEKLRNSTLISEGKIKEFYITLIDIIRDYLSGVYRIETRDLTTNEIFYFLKKKEHDKNKLAYIRALLDEGDLVKFAKHRPEEKTCWQDFEKAKNLVTGNWS